MVTLAIGRFLFPFVEKAFWAMVHCLSNLFGFCKEFRKKNKLVGGGGPRSAPLSGDDPDRTARADIFRRLAASRSRAPDNSNPHGKF